MIPRKDLLGKLLLAVGAKGETATRVGNPKYRIILDDPAECVEIGDTIAYRIEALRDFRAADGRMVRKVGADVVAAACIIELAFLGGRERIDVPMHTLIRYEE